ncbi:RNA polymerase sigma factor [Lachnospiraceae bacterium PM6-15]|uniref:sigma-70 family RNA polymerase sigma factor n=1 Tax=Ohessyouella blattaphilus TaxID=2949333 RepID=UPI003E1E60F6
MDDFSLRLVKCKQDNQELNKLIEEYMPFITSEAVKTGITGLEMEDKVSLAMLTFMNCVKTYEEGRGGFIAYAAMCIRNRILDEGRKSKRQGFIVLHDDDEKERAAWNAASASQYSKEQEKIALREEIERLSTELAEYQIPFTSLVDICPKQKRSRTLCMQMARAILADEEMRDKLVRARQLSVGNLAKRCRVSEKTVEKYRRYVIVLVLILSGDFPYIGTYLPTEKGGED